jgi:superoxide dismutase
MRALAFGAPVPAYDVRALKREELEAMGSVTLHELYFGSLGGDGGVLFTGTGTGTKIADSIATAIEQQFGSVAAWRREFIAQSLSGGSGWTLLTYSRRDGLLYNQIAFDHSQAMMDTVPLLALDMCEHAYHLAFRANATAYIDAFMRNIDWSAVTKRFTEATIQTWWMLPHRCAISARRSGCPYRTRQLHDDRGPRHARAPEGPDARRICRYRRPCLDRSRHEWPQDHKVRCGDKRIRLSRSNLVVMRCSRARMTRSTGGR